MPDLTSPPGTRAACYRFGVFEFDAATGELRRQGRRVALAPQPAAVLALLLERPGQVVTRDELRELLWGGADPTHVDYDQGINTAVRSIRTALGDRAGASRFIETLPRRGYRFLADVERLGAPGAKAGAGAAEDTDLEIGAPRDSASATRSRPPVARRVAGVAVAGLLLLVVWWASRSSPEGAGSPSGTSPREPVAQGERAMLAVLPFDDLGPAEGGEWFSAGLTEELIAQLGRVDPERLGVIARTSVVGLDLHQEDAASIGRRLGVDYLLEGSVRRDDGSDPERVRVTAQLIRTADQTHLWAESFERPLDDVLGVQVDLARRVRESLLGHLLPEGADDAPPEPRSDLGQTHQATPPSAYRHYLRGRYHFTRYSEEGYRAAIASYRRALAEAPDYAAAWAGLAEAHAFLSWAGTAPDEAFPQARRAAERAVELNPASARGHNALGVVRLYYLRDFAGAEASLRRALEIDPGFAEAHHWAAGLYSALGRHDEAIAHDLAARRLDPVSLTVRSDLCWYYAFARRWDEAVTECRGALELEPDHRWSLAGLELAHRRRGEAAAAWRARRRLLELAERLPAELAGEGARDVDAADALRRADALELDRLLAATGEAGGTPDAVDLAMALGRAGRADEAFPWLRRAVEERHAWVVFLDADPRFDPLRDDPRFAALRRQVGLVGTAAPSG